jgi:hypothetical protein
MKPIGKLLKTAEIEGKNWKQELQRFLLQCRSTPHKLLKSLRVNYFLTDKFGDIYQNLQEKM